jgi:hypothetical protein
MSAHAALAAEAARALMGVIGGPGDASAARLAGLTGLTGLARLPHPLSGGAAAAGLSQPGDALEQQATQAAEAALQQRLPPARTAAPAPAGDVLPLARAAAPGAAGATLPAALAVPAVQARVAARRGGGRPLPPRIGREMGARFGADFSAVRLHADAEAQAMAGAVQARAFASGPDIYLGRGEAGGDAPVDRALLAHELAHTVQQGAAAPTRPDGPGAALAGPSAAALARRGTGSATVAPPTPTPLLRLALPQRVLDTLAGWAAALPGFTLLTLVLGRNPITGAAVERSAATLLRGFVGLVPGGEALWGVLERYGVVATLAGWAQQALGALGLTWAVVRGAFDRFLDTLGLGDVFDPGGVWRRAQAIFGGIVARIGALVGGLVAQAVAAVKAALMPPLADFCRQIPGYGLVRLLLGRDPFTGEAVPRTPLALVRAFAEFIPGGTEKVEQLQQSGALERAAQWFVAESAARNLTWARVAGTFDAAWAEVRLENILQPLATLARIGGLFRPLLADLVGFAGAALVQLLEFIYEAAMGAGGRRILALLARVRSTFVVIVRDPVAFLRNLLAAVGQGVRQFLQNILEHLRAGVIAWLAGPVARAGVQIPERWDLAGIVGFVLQILGLTWARVRGKLVRLMGERTVAALEGAFALVQQVRERGLVPALRDRVGEFFGALREGALGAIRGFIQQRIVMAGITQLLLLLSPVGAVIQAIVKTYTTLQFFVQRIAQILEVVESIVESIARIAAGAVGQAAGFIERTMARTIPVVLDFLARFIGLGDVGAQVQRTIQALQQRVDGMLDRAVDWIRRQAAGVASRLLGGDPSAPSADRVRSALREAVPLVNRFAGRPVGALVLRPLLAPLRLRHRLSRLDVVPQGRQWAVVAAASPEVIEPTTALVEGGGIEGLRTRIQYTSGTLPGAGLTVGSRMQADPLGPDHPQGQEPAGANLWAPLLETDPGQPADRKYIRGHLLNHQIGGSGAAQNLFPITAAANDRHESAIESRIKRWVNEERKWVRYEVRIAVVAVDIDRARPRRLNKVDADIVCSAHVLDVTGPGPAPRAVDPVQVTITSRYQAPAGASGDIGPRAETPVAARPADLAATVALPRGDVYQLDAGIYAAIAAARRRGRDDATIRRAIEGVTQVGPAIAATVMAAFGLSPRAGADIAGTLVSASQRSNLTLANARAEAVAAAVAAC